MNPDVRPSSLSCSRNSKSGSRVIKGKILLARFDTLSTLFRHSFDAAVADPSPMRRRCRRNLHVKRGPLSVLDRPTHSGSESRVGRNCYCRYCCRIYYRCRMIVGSNERLMIGDCSIRMKPKVLSVLFGSTAMVPMMDYRMKSRLVRKRKADCSSRRFDMSTCRTTCRPRSRQMRFERDRGKKLIS